MFIQKIYETFDVSFLKVAGYLFFHNYFFPDVEGKRNENYGKQKKLEWKRLIVTVMMIQIQTLLTQNPRRFCPKKSFVSTLIFPPKSRTKPYQNLHILQNIFLNTEVEAPEAEITSNDISTALDIDPIFGTARWSAPIKMHSTVPKPSAKSETREENESDEDDSDHE